MRRSRCWPIFIPRASSAGPTAHTCPSTGHSNRSLVLVDGDGIVLWSHATATPLEIPGANLIFDALDAAA